jgi:cyclic pyranopterin phosphate synthase
MPPEGVPHISHSEILSYEEIQAVVQAAAQLGIRRVRLTGGEPLVRADLPELVRMLFRIEGITELSLTTNGALLKDYAHVLKQAGLSRVNVSLDTLRADRFRDITGLGELEGVLAGIEAAREAGLQPIKTNTVVMRGINDDEILDFARLTYREGWHVRFIELMPFKGVAQPVPSIEVQQHVSSLGRLDSCVSTTGNGPAGYYRLAGAKGTIGFISPLTETSFCSRCNRMRLTPDGKLRPCLLGDDEIDLRTPLRDGRA